MTTTCHSGLRSGIGITTARNRFATAARFVGRCRRTTIVAASDEGYGKQKDHNGWGKAPTLRLGHIHASMAATLAFGVVYRGYASPG